MLPDHLPSPAFTRSLAIMCSARQDAAAADLLLSPASFQRCGRSWFVRDAVDGIWSHTLIQIPSKFENSDGV